VFLYLKRRHNKPYESALLPDNPAYLDVEHIFAGYNGKPALEDLTFQVPHGQRVAVVGPNGAGKSTLFKALVGLLPLRSGEIHIHGLPLGDHQHCVAYIPQREEVDWRFPLSVSDVVMMGRYGHQGWLKRPNRQDREIVYRCLEQMGVSDLAKNSIRELSGGQQQRIFLARALAQEPHILLMDEPFSGIDNPTQETTLALLEELKLQQVTVLVSTHDLNMAAQKFETTLLINHHLIAFGPPSQVFTHENIRRAFGSQLLLMDGAVMIDECCPPNETHRERLE
jgi:ABC-type Mn2+/Zn2+ transport system ATPase subunit